MGALIAGIIVAAAAAMANTIDYFMDAAEAREQIDADKKYLEDQKEADLALLELEFEEAKKEANKNAARAEAAADLSDKEQNLNENYLSNQFNNELTLLQNQQEQDAFSWNVYKMNSDAEKGNSKNQIANSGVRSGSSLEDAVDMQAVVNSQQLELTKENSRTQQNMQLNAITAGTDLNKLNIAGNRINADYQRQDAAELRASYEAAVWQKGGWNSETNKFEMPKIISEGGYNWNVYMNKRAGINRNYSYNVDKLNRQYESVDMSSWKFWVGANNKLMGGATSGFQTGYNIGKSWEDFNS